MFENFRGLPIKAYGAIFDFLTVGECAAFYPKHNLSQESGGLIDLYYYIIAKY